MSKKLHRQLKLTSLAVAMALGVGAAQADERAELETLRQTTLNLIQILVQQGVLTQEKSDQLIKQAEVKAQETVAAQKKADAGVVRVQYVPESVRKQITDQVREEVVAQAKVERWGDANAVPEWVDRIKFEGDVRLGYQGDRFASGNAPEQYFAVQGQTINSTTEDRDRFGLRARLGINAKITPEISAGLRLATGSATSPVSSNQTLGQYGNKANFSLDRAYLKAHSEETLPWLTVSAGRIPNPWFSTDLVWDDDLNFEGVALQIEPNSQASSVWRPFGTLGVFPLQDIEPSSTVSAKSKWLLGAQLGMEWVPSTKTRAKLGLAYYDYRNISGISNTANSSAYDKTKPTFQQKGNTLFNIKDPNSTVDIPALAADYQLLNVTGMVDLTVSNPVHLMLSADFVENIGLSRSKTLARTNGQIDQDLQTRGYMTRVAVGMPNMLLKNDWQVSVAYRYLEADAVLDAFTDSDFHLGGTNNKGFILGAQYGLGKNTWLSARWLSSNEISGLPLAIDVFQVYFNAKF